MRYLKLEVDMGYTAERRLSNLDLDRDLDLAEDNSTLSSN